MTTLALATLAIFAPQADKWEIKPSFEKDLKTEYKMVVNVSMGGEAHTARFTFTSQNGAKGSDEMTSTSVMWHGVELDDNPSDDLPTWEFKRNQRGAVVAAGGTLDDSYRRTITPFYFVFPDKAVGVGDKWEVKFGPKDGFTKSYEVKAVERLQNEDVLKIAEVMKETDGMSSDGTWWVSKSGKALKFEMNVKDWILAFAGPDAVEASIKGDLVKG